MYNLGNKTNLEIIAWLDSGLCFRLLCFCVHLTLNYAPRLDTIMAWHISQEPLGNLPAWTPSARSPYRTRQWQRVVQLFSPTSSPSKPEEETGPCLRSTLGRPALAEVDGRKETRDRWFYYPMPLDTASSGDPRTTALNGMHAPMVLRCNCRCMGLSTFAGSHCSGPEC